MRMREAKAGTFGWCFLMFSENWLFFARFSQLPFMGETK